MDNVNPLTISLYPDESIEIIKSIIKYHTPGDVIALGIESLDPNVIKKNNLKVTYEDAFDVIKLINSLGSKKGNNGIPEILPGLNFIYGLYGETKKTFDINYNFLLDVYNSNLLLRRINIRKLISFDKTNISNQKLNSRYKYSKLFKYHKEKLRKSIDLPLLRKMFPIGTVLKNLFLDNNQNYIENKNIKFCRQFGTYPILVGVLNGSKYKNKPSMFTDIVVIDHGFRSLTGLILPININSENINIIEKIPFSNSMIKNYIIKNRPFKEKDLFIKNIKVYNFDEKIMNYITFD